MTAWKTLELRVAKALGGTRSGPLGRHMSDVQGTPFAVEVKRCKTPPMRAWLTQARRQGKQENKPWLLVVSGHNDPSPFVVMDFKTFASMIQDAA